MAMKLVVVVPWLLFDDNESHTISNQLYCDLIIPFFIYHHVDLSMQEPFRKIAVLKIYISFPWKHHFWRFFQCLHKLNQSFIWVKQSKAINIIAINSGGKSLLTLHLYFHHFSLKFLNTRNRTNRVKKHSLLKHNMLLNFWKYPQKWISGRV